MGRAEDLFERVQRDKVAAIEALIADRATEELFLDFKRSTDDGNGNRLHDRDRGNLRKAIGGFANAEGGLLIWGVECSRQGDIGDVAANMKPVTNPQRFASWLEGAVSGCTVPPVVGVRSVAIPVDVGTGIVATYIPQSSHAPHQIAGEGKYVIRAGSDFVPAPHGVVAGLFGRPPHPVVFPNFAIGSVSFTGDYLEARVTVMLCNNGQVVAEDLFLSLLLPDVPTAGQGVKIINRAGWPATIALGATYSWVCPREFRLAPRGFVEVATIALIVGQPAIADFRCQLTAGCRDAIPDSMELFVSKGELNAEIDRIYHARNNPSDSYDLHRAAKTLLGIQDEGTGI